MAGCQLFHLGQMQVASFPGLWCYLERNSGSLFGLRGSAIPTPLSDFTLMLCSPLISRHRDLPFDLQVRQALSCLGDFAPVPSAKCSEPGCLPDRQVSVPNHLFLDQTGKQPSPPPHHFFYCLPSFFCFYCCCCFQFFYLILVTQGLCGIWAFSCGAGLQSSQARESQ